MSRLGKQVESARRGWNGQGNNVRAVNLGQISDFMSSVAIILHQLKASPNTDEQQTSEELEFDFKIAAKKPGQSSDLSIPNVGDVTAVQFFCFMVDFTDHQRLLEASLAFLPRRQSHQGSPGTDSFVCCFSYFLSQQALPVLHLFLLCNLYSARPFFSSLKSCH